KSLPDGRLILRGKVVGEAVEAELSAVMSRLDAIDLLAPHVGHAVGGRAQVLEHLAGIAHRRVARQRREAWDADQLPEVHLDPRLSAQARDLRGERVGE